MNIPQIMGLRIMSPLTEHNKQYDKQSGFGLTMTSPLRQDTVSFTATAKKLESRIHGVSLHVARMVSRDAEPMQEKVRKFIHDMIGDLVVTELNPKNPVYALKDRVKTPRSVMEKSQTRQLNNRAEILNFMTDLNGAKIVMRDGRKKSVEKVLARLIKPIEKGEIELLEIENKRPIVTKGWKHKKSEQYDYASVEFLEKLQQIQEEKWANSNLKEQRTVRMDMNDYTEINYPAIHFLFKLPEEARPFEFVVLGRNVDRYKDLDDKLFKILNNKEVDKQYKPLVEIIEPLKEKGNADQLKLFNKYRGEAFLFQREKDPNIYNDADAMDYFLPLSCDLPPKYDLNNLYRIMQECDDITLTKPKKKAKRKF